MALAAFSPGRIQATPWTFTSVKSFGATGNGTTDDTLAITRAITTHTAIYFPPGTYRFVGRMSLNPDTSYRLFGDGPGVSTILFEASSGTMGIYGEFGLATLFVDGLTLKSNSSLCGNNCGTAIDAAFVRTIDPPTGLLSGKLRTADIHNVQILGSTRDGNGGTYWSKGIRLLDAQAAVIDKLEISGKKNETTFGILWETLLTCDFVTGIHLSNSQIKYCNRALETNGHVEGIYMTQFEITSCGWANGPAIKIGTQSDPFIGGVITLVNGRIDSVGNGVDISNYIYAKISDVYFKHSDSDPVNGTMLKMFNVKDATVTECTFHGVNSVQSEYGIVIDDVIPSPPFAFSNTAARIDGCNFTHMQPSNQGYCIGLTGASTRIRITDNLFSDIRQQYFPVPFPGPPTAYTRGNNP